MARLPLRSRARALLRREQEPSPFTRPVRGCARLGRKTKDLVKRLGPEDIAVIDHADLDRIAAEDLVASGVRAVVNVKPSSSRRVWPSTTVSMIELPTSSMSSTPARTSRSGPPFG